MAATAGCIPLGHSRLIGDARARHRVDLARAGASAAANWRVRNLRATNACAPIVSSDLLEHVELDVPVGHIFFSRQFSCSSCRRRLTSAGSSVPKCFREPSIWR